MDLVKLSIEKPVAVICVVVLVVLFGVVSLRSLPYQLAPSVTTPEITVTTNWPGATPYELERDVVEEQEDVLKGLAGLIEMESQCYNGQSEITLTFKIGTDIDSALLRASNKLDEVPDYPENVDRPIISATGANTSPVVWMILRSKGDDPDGVIHYQTFFENDVRQYLERVDGVADLFVGGGTENEMQIVADPEKLAAYNLTIPQLMDVIGEENSNVSAGTMGVGRREWRIRTPAEFKSPEEIENAVISSTGAFRVRVKDVAEVRRGFEKPQVAMLHNGERGIVVGVEPESGANVLDVTDAVEQVVGELNDGILAENGLYLEWVYDQRPYIGGAIDLVQQNIIIGGILAVAVLLIFLQSLSATIIVAVAIPVSIIGSFVIFSLAGRSLNVVSMAGISFAVGMLVDNAIVVLENIDRHRSMGKGPFKAAYEGAKEVWSAVLASTLTTVAVFLPVVFIQEEAGQLFKDIASAVTCAILLSLFVSISVIPMLAKQLYGMPWAKKRENGGKKDNAITRLGARAVDGIMRLLALVVRNWRTQVATVLVMVLSSLLLVWAVFPKLEYLPQGNRNLILNILIPPPGLSFDERMDIGEYIYDQVEPHYEQEIGGLPTIEDLFYVSAPSINIFGVISGSEQRAAELIPLFNRIIFSIPGMYGVSIQSSIFEQGLGEGRNISVDLSGASLEQLIAAGGTMYGVISQQIPGAQIRPVPSLEMLYPEARMHPLRDRVRSVGMSAKDLGLALDVINDGRQVGDYKEEGKKKIDLVLKSEAEGLSTPEDIYNALVATPQGVAVPVSNLAELERTYGVSQIRHLERRRTITLQVTPPPTMPLQQAMETIEQQTVPAVRQMGMLDGVRVDLSGAADKLTVTARALGGNFLMAVLITYLLMSALFGNFIYPFIILLTVPLAGAGGFLGLELVSLIKPQTLDVLTMLGFVILIGVVVNNAILIVHQSLVNVRELGMEYREAVLESARTRLRPIYMSASTSIFGMLPLAVFPGPGSELYRGLGAVVLGGLALSTVFTVFMIPALLMFFIKMEKPGSRQS